MLPARRKTMEKRGFVVTIVLLIAAAAILGNLPLSDSNVGAQAVRQTITKASADPNYPLLPQGAQQQSSGMQQQEIKTCTCPVSISIPNGDRNDCGGKALDVCSNAQCSKRVWATDPEGKKVLRRVTYDCEVHEVCSRVPYPCNQASFQDYIQYSPYDTWWSTCTRTKTCASTAKDCALATCTFRCVSDEANEQGTGPLWKTDRSYPCGL